MVSYKEIHKDINKLTSQLIQCGLCVEQNFPSIQKIGSKDYEISYTNVQDISVTMRNLKYEEIYQQLNRNKNYNIKMIDGALIQLFYIYKKAKIASHRLAFFHLLF